MRTTLDLPSGALDELMNLMEAKSKGEAVTIAIQEYIRRQKRLALKGASGSLHVADNWREQERAQLREAVNAG